MLVGVGIVFGKLVALPPKTHHMAPVNTAHPRAAVTAFLDIVFTFGGQVQGFLFGAHAVLFCLPHCDIGSCSRELCSGGLWS